MALRSTPSPSPSTAAAAVALLVLAAAPAGASAQAVWSAPDRRPAVWLQVLRPEGSLSDFEFPGTAWYLGGRLDLWDGGSLVAELTGDDINETTILAHFFDRDHTEDDGTVQQVTG